MKFQRIIFLSLLLISTFSLYGQRNGVKYGSEGYSEVVNRGADRFTRLVKNVWFDIKEKDTYITGDSALYYDKQGIMIVFGDVRIKKGDSVNITARRLNYYMKDNKAELRNDVVYTDNRIRLTTNYLDYFTNTEDARFYNGGTIVDGETTLKAQDAYVINAENLIKFYEDVSLKSPDYDLKTDTLFYDQITKIATTFGPTQTIMKDGEIIDAEEGGRFYTDSKQVNYIDGKITTENYEIFGDDLFFDDIRQESRAKGNVRVISEEDNIIILGDIATTKKDSGITKIWGNPVMKQLVEGDTLYVTADTLISIDSKIDSLSRLLAFKNVKIFKSDMQGVADSMAYMMADSMIFLYRDPVLWNDGNQLTADTISMEMKNGKLDKMHMKNRAFTVNKDTISNFNQIKGRDMTAFFKDDQMDRIMVYGNGESIYFALDEKTNTVTGMNKILCSNMKIQFVDGKMNDITFYKDPEGKFIPPHEISEPETRLKDFKWQIERKPSLNEVLGKYAPAPLPAEEQVKKEVLNTSKPAPTQLKDELKKTAENEN